jgi:5-methylcytosine-specific restriction endonuclease McrA
MATGYICATTPAYLFGRTYASHYCGAFFITQGQFGCQQAVLAISIGDNYMRTLVLVLNEKATILARIDHEVVRSASQEFEMPSVILLSRYVRIPNARRVPVSRRGVLRRDSQRCGYCAGPANTIDHIMPKSRGGKDTWENLVACCLECNNSKGNRTPAEIGWNLKVLPKMPTGTVWSVRGSDRPLPQWSEFLALQAKAA